jgi:iron complex transport system ATP-binding protein
MRDGRIVAEGPPAEIVTEDLVRTVFDLEARVIDDPVSHTPLVVPVGRHAIRPAPHLSLEDR